MNEETRKFAITIAAAIFAARALFKKDPGDPRAASVIEEAVSKGPFS